MARVELTTEETSMRVQSERVAGVAMRWLEQGQGPPVIVIHGIPTSPALWRKVVPLVESAQCFAWEMVGYGESIPEGRGRDISVAQQASYLTTWMAARGISRAVLVGHDLGGGVAHIAAARDPASCAGLVLTSSIGYDSWPIRSVVALQRSGPVVERLPMTALKGLLATLLFRGHDDMRVARESLAIHAAPYERHDGARALIRQMRALDRRDTIAVQDDLPRLRGAFPARVVWGAADPFQKLAYGGRFSRDLGCQFITVEGGKHFMPEDHPDVVAAAVEDTLREAEFRPPHEPRPPAPPPAP